VGAVFLRQVTRRRAEGNAAGIEHLMERPFCEKRDINGADYRKRGEYETHHDHHERYSFAYVHAPA